MNLRPEPQYLARPIYLDGHATTPCDHRVVQAILPMFASEFGNPSSNTHAYGGRAAEAVRQARESVAALIGASPGQIVFTSGATEACNLAIKGIRRRRIVTVATEHKAVLASCARLSQTGVEVIVLPVKKNGLVDLVSLEAELARGTDLVAVMAANNEIGVLQPISTISNLCAHAGAQLLVDATQWVGWLPLDLSQLSIDFVALSAHKLHGPKGAGALYCSNKSLLDKLQPILDGGGQERGLRAGTLNVPAIVGFGKAASICRDENAQSAEQVAAIRDEMLEFLLANLDGVVINGSEAARLPNNISVAFEGVEAEALLNRLPDLALSTGSACYSGTPESSYVIRALGVSDELAWSTIRIGLLRSTTAAEAAYAARRIVTEVECFRHEIGWRNKFRSVVGMEPTDGNGESMAYAQ